MANKPGPSFLVELDPLTTSMTASGFEPNTFSLAHSVLACDKQMGITVTDAFIEFRKFQILTLALFNDLHSENRPWCFQHTK